MWMLDPIRAVVDAQSHTSLCECSIEYTFTCVIPLVATKCFAPQDWEIVPAIFTRLHYELFVHE